MIGMMVKIYPKSGEEDAVEEQMKKFYSTCSAGNGSCYSAFHRTASSSTSKISVVLPGMGPTPLAP
jgi:hypothetical protein